MPSGMQHIIMLPHIIIIGMPIFIMPFIISQHCIIISWVMLPIGIMVHIILSPIISHFMVQVIMGIIIGIMPPIIGFIMPLIIIWFIIGIWGIMPFIIGIGMGIWGIMFIIGIAGIIKVSCPGLARSPLGSPRRDSLLTDELPAP
jgi:hypothetical protein